MVFFQSWDFARRMKQKTRDQEVEGVGEVVIQVTNA